jgi:hypothetical protein
MSTPKGLTIVRAEVYETQSGPSGCEAILFCDDEDQTQLYCYNVEDCLRWFSLNFTSVDFTVERVNLVWDSNTKDPLISANSSRDD